MSMRRQFLRFAHVINQLRDGLQTSLRESIRPNCNVRPELLWLSASKIILTFGKCGAVEICQAYAEVIAERQDRPDTGVSVLTQVDLAYAMGVLPGRLGN